MRLDLLPRDGQFYKANLHSHSTLSDGHVSPLGLKQVYKKKGYSVFAYTEHSVYHDLREKLDDKDFITLPSYEAHPLRAYETTPFPAICDGPAPTPNEAEAIHLNMFAIDPDKTTKEVDMEDINTHSLENINELIRRGREAGFLVSYNHPHWSLNSAELYNKLEGLSAIELINGACNRSSALDFVPHVMREMAWNGKRLVAFAGDDNHRPRHLFQAWTMIKAPELSHKAVINAMQKGDCYVSSGPEIKELYVEDGKVYVKCSDAARICYSTRGRRVRAVSAESGCVNEAVFEIKDTDGYFRIDIIDECGLRANTQAYRTDETAE